MSVLILAMGLLCLSPLSARADEAGIALVRRVLNEVMLHYPVVCDYVVTFQLKQPMLKESTKEATQSFKFHKVVQTGSSSTGSSSQGGEFPFQPSYLLFHTIDFVPARGSVDEASTDKAHYVGKEIVEGVGYEVVEVQVPVRPLFGGTTGKEVTLRWYVGADNLIHRITASVPPADFLNQNFPGQPALPKPLPKPVPNPVLNPLAKPLPKPALANPLPDKGQPTGYAATDRVVVEAVLRDLHKALLPPARPFTNPPLPARIPLEDSITAMTLSPNGAFLARAKEGDNCIRVYETVSGGQKLVLEGQKSRVQALQFSQHSRWLASSNPDGICLWDLRTGNRLRTWNAQATGMAFSADNRRLVTYGLNMATHVWDTGTGQEVFHMTEANPASVHHAVLSPDGKKLAALTLANTVEIWDLASGQRAKSYPGVYGFHGACAYSPDGKWLAFQRMDNHVQICDAQTGEVKQDLSGATGKLSALEFLDDNKTLAAVDADERGDLPSQHPGLLLWSTTDWQLRESRELADSMYAGNAGAVLAPQGRRLLLPVPFRSVKIWDLAETLPKVADPKP